MLNLFKHKIGINLNPVHNNLLVYIKSKLFFFKFIKFKGFFKNKNLIFVYHKLIISNQFKLTRHFKSGNYSRKYRYKKYSIFKFRILKYRRKFNPRYWYKFNYFLLTRYNFLNYPNPTVTHTKQKPMGLKQNIDCGLIPIVAVSYNHLKVMRSNRSYTPNNFIKYYILKKKTHKIRLIRFFDQIIRFLSWRYRTKKLQRFVNTDTIRRTNKKLGKTYNLLNKYVPRMHVLRRPIKNYPVDFVKTVRKTSNTSFKYKSFSKLTNYSYMLGSLNRQSAHTLTTLKIMFNTYNYKTYNWRIIN